MDSRLIMLAAAAAAVIAVVLLAVYLVGRSRRRKHDALAADEAAWTASSGSVPEIVQAPSSLPSEPPVVLANPTAELLTPMPTGEWSPPAEPAPAAKLPAISLAERSKAFPARIPEVRPEVAVVPEPEPGFVWQPPAAVEAAAPKAAVSLAELQMSLRPRAQARHIPEPMPATAVAPRPPSESPRMPEAARAEFVEMVAPVEMWFGEYRVGVKAGSTTHARFRKYADTLLGDLKGVGDRTR